jgi:hypothetical protein
MSSRRDIAFLRSAAASLALVGSLFLASCAKQETPAYLAKVGDRAITAADLQNEIDRQKKTRRSVPDREEVLREMVRYEAQLLQARKAGLADDPQIRREIGLLLIGKLRERELSPRLESVQVTTNEVQAEYEQNIAKYTQPAKARVALLYLQVNPKASDARRAETMQRLQEARRRALEPTAPTKRGPSVAPGFGTLAINFSDDQASRYRGGDIGWLEAGKFESRWPRPVLEAVFALKKQGMTDVIEADGGFYLGMKTDERDTSVTPLAKVEATIRHSLLLKKRREMEEAFSEDAVRLAEARIDQKALASFKLKPTAAEVAQNGATQPPSFPFASEPAHEN